MPSSRKRIASAQREVTPSIAQAQKSPNSSDSGAREVTETGTFSTTLQEIVKAVTRNREPHIKDPKNGDLCGAVVSEVEGWVGTVNNPKAQVEEAFRTKLENVFVKGRQGTCYKENRDAMEGRIAFVKRNDYYMSVVEDFVADGSGNQDWPSMHLADRRQLYNV